MEGQIDYVLSENIGNKNKAILKYCFIPRKGRDIMEEIEPANNNKVTKVKKLV